MKNIRTTIGIVLLMIMSVSLMEGQEQNSLSLKNAISDALKDNPSMLSKILLEKSASIKVNKQKLDLLPELSLSAGIRHNFDIAATPIPMKFIDPTSGSDEIFPAKFATKNTANWGINFSYDLFNPAKLKLVSSEKKRAGLSKVDVLIQKSILTNQVRIDYAGVLIAQKQLVYCKSDSLHAVRVLDYTQNRFAEGLASKEDVLVAKENVNEMKLRGISANTDLLLAQNRLLSDIGLDPEQIQRERLNLTDRLEDLMLDMQALDLHQNHSLGAERDSIQIALSKEQWKKSNMAFLPTLTLVGFYGGNFYNKQLNLTNSEHWYSNSYLGLKLSLPILEDFGKNEDRKIAKLNYKMDRIEAENNRINRAKALGEKQAQLDKAKKELLIRKENVTLHEERFSILNEQMKEGQIYPAKLQEGLKDLQKSHTDYLQAIYNVFVANANLELSLIN